MTSDKSRCFEPNVQTQVLLGQLIHDPTRGEHEISTYAIGICRDSGRQVGPESPSDDQVTWIPLRQLDVSALEVDQILVASWAARALQFVNLSGLQLGDSTLICGNDPWSLLILQIASLQGASPLVVAGFHVDNDMHETLFQLGASNIIAGEKPHNFALHGGPFAVVFDCLGSATTFTTALAGLRDGGKYLLTSLDPQQSLSFNAYPDLHRRDLQFIAPTGAPLDERFERLIVRTLWLAGEGRLQLDPLLANTERWSVCIKRYER